MERSLADVRRDLERDGYVFSRFEWVEVGRYAPSDVDWNQRDLAHVAHVHGALGAVPVAVSDDRSASFLFQRVAGFRLPLSVAHFAVAPGRHFYFTSFACFVLFSESSFSSVEGKARVETCFHVGSPRWLKLFHPWIGRILLRNHERIDREDLPLRARRAALRGRGYGFTNDSPATYRGSLNLAQDNVVAPVSAGAGWRQEVGPFDGQPRTVLLGSDGHDGVRVEARDGELRVYPRMCAHDGACLDDARHDGDALVCPWHGRAHRPLARLRLDAPEVQRVATSAHDLELRDHRLTVVFKG
ncbi:MAG: Rieske 2Fe-2S domain-containing protein [bacterium]